jgi:hypothetical protein
MSAQTASALGFSMATGNTGAVGQPIYIIAPQQSNGYINNAQNAVNPQGMQVIAINSPDSNNN